MDFKSQNNQPSQPRQQVDSSEPVSAMSRVSHVQSSKVKGSKLPFIISVVLVVLIVAGFYAYNYMSSPARAIDSSKFQAVFLTNGQVYFGKLKSVDGSYAKLGDIYYLQVQQSVQPAGNSSTSTSGNSKDSQVSLTKLGNELHGPVDEMNIASDQILFWENLKDDGTVVKAIKNHETK